MKSSTFLRAAAALLLLFGAGACGGTRPLPLGRPAPGEAILYPQPPDTPRVQFLAAFTTEEDVSGRKGRTVLDRIIGADEESRRRVASIDKPYGVAMSRGRIYVCDSMMPGVIIMDLRARTFEQFSPKGEGALRKPINCAVDRDSGRLFVADAERGQVVVYDSLRNYVAAFGEGGARPSDVFIDREGIWVADPEAVAIQLYDPVSFALIRSFAGGEAEAERLRAPTNLWVEGDEVFVSDLAAMQILVFDRQGRYKRSIGGAGIGPGQFARPKGIAVDRSGILYVVDAAFENVQMFNSEGRVLTFFGGEYTGPGGMLLPAKVALSYDDLDLFQEYVDPRFEIRHLILVTNQYGPDRVAVYAFVTPRQGALVR